MSQGSPSSTCWFKWMFPKIGGKHPKWMVYFMENPVNKWMIWVVLPLFLETPKCVSVPGSHECHARVGRQRCGIGSHHGWAWQVWNIQTANNKKEHLKKNNNMENIWNFCATSLNCIMKLYDTFIKHHETIWNIMKLYEIMWNLVDSTPPFKQGFRISCPGPGRPFSMCLQFSIPAPSNDTKFRQLRPTP